MRFIKGGVGAVITPGDVELELVEIVEQLERGHELLVGYERELAQTSVEFELDYARALRAAEGAADVRKATALLECEGLYRAKCDLEVAVRCCRAAQHDLRAHADVVRSIGASVRVAMGAQ